MVTSLFILFSPLTAFLLSPVFPERNRKWLGWITVFGMFVSFLLSVKLAIPLFSHQTHGQEMTGAWIAFSTLNLNLGFVIDSLSVLMLLIVTGVGSLIFYYSLEYMEHDEGYRRYFAGLSLFAFSMIGIVISSNLIQLFIFWELVGLSSYLLIGHWYQKPEAADAGKKAFLTNRVGDFGFLIGILLLWSLSNTNGIRTLDISNLSNLFMTLLKTTPAYQITFTLAMLLILMGVAGKSAQFPLHVWLPDAMEGPTPVSALIHAATMVAAGVYLLARLFPLYVLSPFALNTIAYLGGFTAIFAATQALVQNDIKRILAYSTLSQLGYMVMAVGLGSASVAMYHLSTHAFFKALLFLATGSIIHSTHEQDIWKMGGLFKKIPFTSSAFFVGSFALAGLWPSSGFFSKDEILALAFTQNKTLFYVGLGTVFLTAFYITRAIVITFFGNCKINKEIHEPTQKMILPLVVLSVLSIVAGWFHIQKLIEMKNEVEVIKNEMVIFAASGLGLAGILTAILLYAKKQPLNQTGFAYQILIRKYYMDDLYNAIIRHIQQPIASLCAWCEKRIIVDGINIFAGFVVWIGRILRKLQTGKIQSYLSVFFVGIIILIYLVLVKNLS